MKFLFLLMSLLSFAQEQTVSGFVLDQNGNAPIPYVNISILKSQEGTSSDVDGSFKLLLSEVDKSKYVKFSSLGYKDSTISAATLLGQKTIYLEPLTELLDEVVLTKRLEEQTIKVNPITEEDLCQGFGSHAKNPWILALYFPFEEHYEATDYLKTVHFYFGNFKNIKSKFRLRLFSIGDNGLPEDDLLKENVVIELKKKQKLADIDISDYNIIFPRDGFYVAVEWLYIPSNAEKVTYISGPKNKTKRKGLKYNPTFSGICVEEGTFKLAVYNSGEWRFHLSKKFQSEEKVIPAISLTLSN